MEENQSLFSLNIDPVTKTNLNSIANWARFLAIVGLLVLLVALAASILTLTIFSDNIIGSSWESDNGQQIARTIRLTTAIGVIIGIAIGFFPCIYLLKFATRMKRALQANSQEELNRAFSWLKIYFRYVGIITLILIIIYALTFIFQVMVNL